MLVLHITLRVFGLLEEVRQHCSHGICSILFEFEKYLHMTLRVVGLLEEVPSELTAWHW